MRKAVRKAKDGSFKGRWKDVVVWKAFWEELEEILLTRTRESFLAGCKVGEKDGARRERRAARRIVHVAMSESNHEHCDACWYIGEIVLEKLAARAKPAKGGVK